MHPSIHARTVPDKPAYIVEPSSEVVTYGELDARSNQGAHLFRATGLKPGDVVAIFLENSPRYLEIAWAAQRSGLYFTCIPSSLTAVEAAYILKDSRASLLITSCAIGEAALQLPPLVPDVALYMTGEPIPPYASFERARNAMPETPIDDEVAGIDLLYSSGTTGRPKGIVPSDIGGPIETPPRVVGVCRDLLGFTQDSIYLSPAPLYHAAPLRYNMAVHRLGGTSVVMERFNAELALALIERHGVTCGQFVPTHFIRMLGLPDAVRQSYDVSSLRSVVHAAAPCPVPVKERMIDWWGPIVHEYYSSTEASGFCFITAEEWLAHKGSVGRARVGTLHICDETGQLLPPRREGLVYFENAPPVRYLNDPEKTADAYNRHGWSTVGDIGWVDEDGYLYLTDRKSFMIISGGVNIYPQEIENVLIGHPAVADVAVIGAPDPDFGERVVAVIQPVDWSNATDLLAEDLRRFARANLSHVKVPRQFDFMQALPREETGKLYKRLIRDTYWDRPGGRPVSG